MKTNVASMTGPWQAGLTLDLHTLSAQFLGEDSSGRPQFETIRSEVGEALYRAKYKADKAAAADLAKEAAKQVRKAKFAVDVVVPVPPSKARSYQPLLAMAKLLATELGVDFDGKSLRKVKETPELKSMDDVDERRKALAGAFAVEGDGLAGRHVLLVDDLYRSGATMAEVARTIKKAGRAKSVSTVALTRTRSKS
jgi:competence protein ComFC